MKTILIISTLLNMVGVFFIFKFTKGVKRMFMFDENNPVVISWVTAVKLYGFEVEQITNLCGLRDAVIKVLEKEKAEEK